MKKFLLFAIVLLQCGFVYSQKMTLILQARDNFNLPGGLEGKNYAAIIKTKESKKGIVTKSLNFMKKYGFVPGDTKVDAIDESQSEVTYKVILPLTMFYQQMLHLDANKLYSNLRFEFHDSNVMIVFENMSNEVLGLYWHDDSKKPSDAYTDYRSESAGLTISHTLVGKFLVHANLDPAERQSFYREADKYFSNIAERYKSYEQLVKNGEAKWLDADGVIKQYTDNPVPGSKYLMNYLNIPENKERLLGITQKRWDKQVKEFFDNLFKSFCLELNGDIDGVAEDGEQTFAWEDGKLLPIDAKLKKEYIKKGWDYFNKE
jgi:hypothetical protein